MIRVPPLTLAERLEGTIARAIMRLPAPLILRLSGEPAVTRDGQTLDPHVQLLRATVRRRGARGLLEPTVERGRVRYQREAMMLVGTPTGVGRVRDLDLPGGAGTLRARHYTPHAAGGSRAPLLLYLHGGGFVIGDLDSHDEPCRLLCRHGAMHVLSIAYRLAPEHPFPAALDDARAALTWALDNADSLGADATRVGIGGDSAGGNLATVSARLATRAGRPCAAQLLIYPATDLITERPSQSLFGDGYFLTTADAAAFLRYYTGNRSDMLQDPRAAPMRADDLGGLPPALVVTAGFDILRDEGEAYAAALRASGTPAESLRFPSLVHGFLHMTALSLGARGAVETIARTWRALLDTVAR